MSNSPLAVYTKLSLNTSGKRTHRIDRITPHCVVGQCSVESLGDWFYPASTQASSNYGIGKDGRIAVYVPEDERAWTSSNRENDQRAITIECASDTTEPYAMRDEVYQSLIKLCVDCCKRNGKTKLLWFADKTKTLSYEPKADEMILTVHRWFASKSCPGEWLYSRLGDLAAKVTAQLQPKEEPKPVEQPNPTEPKKEEKPVEETKTETQPTCTCKTYRHLSDVKLATYKATLNKLVEKGLLKGKGMEENGDMILDMDEGAIRVLVILDRAGCFGE